MGVVFKELAKVAPRFARISAVEDLIPPLQSEALEIAVSHFRLEKRTLQSFRVAILRRSAWSRGS